MPFDLKKAKTIYQRLANKMFVDLIKHSVEVYVDDIIIKIKHTNEHIIHLSKTFDIL